MVSNSSWSTQAPLLVVFLMAAGVGLAVSACDGGPEPAPPPPTAKPVVLRHEVQTALFADNAMAVEVRNDGADGWVRVLFTTSDTATEVRREPDAVKWMKNTFTSEGSAGFTVQERRRLKGAWDAYAWLKAGETRWVTFDMPGHSSFDDQNTPTVTAVSSVPENGKVK